MNLTIGRGLALCFLVVCVPAAFSQTTINGSSLAVKSTGSGGGGNWTIDRKGYVGTYFTLAAPGSVTVNVNAAGMPSSGIDPHMNFVLADMTAGFDVASGLNGYEHTFDLPASTYFLRTELNNDREVSSRALTVQDLTVTGATVSNVSNNSNALSAADTYIENFRKGNVKIGVSGVAPGTEVSVSLKQHDFNFGTAVPGFSTNTVNNYLGNGGTSRQTNYQSRLDQNFNAVVPETVENGRATRAHAIMSRWAVSTQSSITPKITTCALGCTT